VCEEGEERDEGGAGRSRKEFHDFVRDTVWAGGLASAERVNRFIECIARDHVGEGDGGVTAGIDDEWVRLVRMFSRRDWKRGWGGAGEFVVQVRVDNGFGSAYSYGVGSSDFMEGRGGTAMGEETAFNF
jgi:hypothetical protein